ncbi:MAG TPA: efflux transporter outer membrane subunit [Gemmatimonadales bacterium]|nr:efflux transporter outer membrane subunit [Gemmatimonadales bacterium]
MMRRLSFAFAGLSVMVGACAVGPHYQPVAPAGVNGQVGAGQTDTATRSFFDSLATARASDSAARMQPAPATANLTANEIGDLAWLDLLRDSALVDLVQTALHQNRELQQAVARIQEFRAEVGVARAPLFPSISASGTASTNRVTFGTGTPISYQALQVAGNVAWELDFWGKTRRGLQAAQADLGAQEAAQRSVVLSLVSDVATGYLQLLELDQERAIAESTLVSRRATLALARSRFQQGLTSELDVRQFEAQVSAPAVRLAQVDRLRAEQEHALSVLIGAEPRSIHRGVSLSEAVAALHVPDSLPARLLERRPDVRQAERALAAATARIGVAQAARLPAVTITGFYGTQAPNSDRLFSSSAEVYQLQAGISIPLFTGGRLVNATRAARARAEQARAAYEQTALEALREAGDALVGVRTARDEVIAQQTQAEALSRALHLAELRYRTGVSNYLEVLEAQRGLFDAQLALSQAQLRQLTAAVQLYKALGGSWNEQK